MTELNNLKGTLLPRVGNSEPKPDKIKEKAREIYDRACRVFCSDFELPLESMPIETRFCLKFMALEMASLEIRMEKLVARSTPSTHYRDGHDQQPVERPDPEMAGGW